MYAAAALCAARYDWHLSTSRAIIQQAQGNSTLNALSVKDMTATLAQHQTGATSEIQFSDMQLLRIEACAISVLRIEVARALLKPLDLLSLPCCCPSRAREELQHQT